MNSLKDNLPLLSVIILIIGGTNLLVYYWYFGIDIMSYVEFSEVIQLQFKVFALAGCLFAASFLYGLLFEYHHLSPASTSYQRQNRKKFATDVDASKNKRHLMIAYCIIGTTLIGGVTSLVWRIISKGEDWTSLLLLSLPLLILIVAIAYFRFRKGIAEGYRARIIESGELISKEFATKEENKLIGAGGFLSLFIVLIYTSSLYTFCSARLILVGPPSQEVTMYLEKDTVVTSNIYRYVGKTKGFIFFYNKRTEQADIYAAGSIKRMKIHDGAATVNKKE